MKKLLALCMLVLLTVALAGCGGGQKKAAYPADGDITVIIPKAPGGGTDTSARGLIQFLQKDCRAASSCRSINRTAAASQAWSTWQKPNRTAIRWAW